MVDVSLHELSVWRMLSLRQWQASGEVEVSYEQQPGASGCGCADSHGKAAVLLMTGHSWQRGWEDRERTVRAGGGLWCKVKHRITCISLPSQLVRRVPGRQRTAQVAVVAGEVGSHVSLVSGVASVSFLRSHVECVSPYGLSSVRAAYQPIAHRCPVDHTDDCPPTSTCRHIMTTSSITARCRSLRLHCLTRTSSALLTLILQTPRRLWLLRLLPLSTQLLFSLRSL